MERKKSLSGSVNDSFIWYCQPFLAFRVDLGNVIIVLMLLSPYFRVVVL